MKALSLGLVRGFIDQVDEKVYMTWVQPRVLDLSQVRDYLMALFEKCFKWNFVVLRKNFFFF